MNDVDDWAAATRVVRFQDYLIIITGKNLEQLYCALERLAVDRIRLLPPTQRTFPKSEGFIEGIEIQEPKEQRSEPE